MRIVIDMQYVQTTSAKRGIGRYASGLIKALCDINTDHEIILALNDLSNSDVFDLKKSLLHQFNADNVVIGRGITPTQWRNPINAWRREASTLLREAFINSLNPDLILLPSIFEGLHSDVAIGVHTSEMGPPTVGIVYDLIPLLSPDVYLSSQTSQDWYAHQLAALKRTNLLLAISDYSRLEAIENLHFNPANIVSISAGLDPAFRKIHLNDLDAKEILSKYGIRGRFILTAGGVERRKNIEQLVKAFSFLPETLQEQFELIVMGCNDAFSQNLVQNEWTKLYGLSSAKVRGIAHIPDDDLIKLYNLCDVFVFPSWHEGFGLPPLEAMACGAPTLASNLTSLPEVIGRDDTLFDPHSAKDIAEKLKLVLCNAELRIELSKWGTTHSRQFTWEKSAKIALKAMESLEPLHVKHQSTSNIRQSTVDLVEKIALIKTTEIPSEYDLRALSEAIARNEAEAIPFQKLDPADTSLSWRIEGPFDSSYSLALVNREFARGLIARGQTVSLLSTDGPGNYQPAEEFLARNSDIASRVVRPESSAQIPSAIVARDLYPPRVFDMDGDINLLHSYAWEESGFPLEWVTEFNFVLNGMLCLSEHVKKIMIDHGFHRPIFSSGCGVDHWERIEADHSFKVASDRKFKFLHVSSCFPRKGVEAMLAAYGAAFTQNDDVVLIIKTFQNEHNQIDEWLRIHKQANNEFPDVIVIKENYTDSKLKALYEQCDVLIAPSKAEGFGLPIAEAMLSGIPVITTAWGGQLDFCNKQTAWLIDYDFARAETHFGLYSSVWAKPKISDLVVAMKTLVQLPRNERIMRSLEGQKKLLKEFKWVDVADRALGFVEQLKTFDYDQSLSVSWVSTWNTRCGIASYSDQLIKNMDANITIFAPINQGRTGNDDATVFRNWSVGEDDYLYSLEDSLIEHGADAVVFQFNYGFFNFVNFSRLLMRLKQKEKIVVIVLHSTIDPAHAPEKRLSLLVPALLLCDRIVVHSVDDLNRLKQYGLINNVVLFPHGVYEPKNISSEWRNKTDFVIGSYGFALPNKGLFELVQAFNILAKKDGRIRLKLVNSEYPVAASGELISLIKQYIEDHDLGDRAEIISSYLTDEASLQHLAKCHLVVFPYQESGESSSAAVRHGLAARRPVAVTPLSIFDDVGDAVFRLVGTSIDDIHSGIMDLMQDIEDRSVRYQSHMKAAEIWRAQHAYPDIARRFQNMLVALKIDRKWRNFSK